MKQYRLIDATGNVLGDFKTPISAKLHIPGASYWEGVSDRCGDYDGWASGSTFADYPNRPQYRIRVVEG